MESEVIHHNMSILLNGKKQSYELFLNSRNGKYKVTKKSHWRTACAKSEL